MAKNKINIVNYGFTILQIETAARCNMNCSFCSYPMRKNKDSVLDERYIYEAIDSLEADNRMEYICLSHLNEPLMDMRIFDMIRYVKRRDFPVMVITNGLLLGKEQIPEKLIESEPDYIKISLQNLNERQFYASRGLAYPYAEYKKGIFDFLRSASGIRSRIYIDVAFNFLTKRDRLLSKMLGLEMGDPSITDIVSDLKEDAKQFLLELNDACPGFTFDGKALDTYIDGMSKSYLKQDGFHISDTVALKFKKFIYGKRFSEFIPAGNGTGCASRIISIVSTGAVIPCCLISDNGEMDMGNIKQEGFAQIVERNREYLSELRAGKNLSGICRRCLGAPTRRGVFIRKVYNTLNRR